jgi:hypothetical protein
MSDEDIEQGEHHKITQSSQPTEKGPLKIVASVLMATFAALIVSFFSIFSKRVADIKETKAQLDGKKTIEINKKMLADQKANLERERSAIITLEESIKHVANQVMKCTDPVKKRRLKEEAVSYIRLKNIKESSLKNARTQIQALEETMSQYEQFSNSMEINKQMQPLIKSMKMMIPSKSTIQKIKRDRIELSEATRKINAELRDINSTIIQEGDEHHAEQEDEEIDMNSVVDREFDGYIEALEAKEAEDLSMHFPVVPLTYPAVNSTVESKSHSIQIQMPTPHVKETESEFNCME